MLAASAASAPTQSLDPPQLLQPAAGQSFKAGTQIGFTVRTFPGDRYLWLYVSRSPTVANACGTIAHEVSIWDFKPTADPSVYEARPTYYRYDSFWMNTPGTYYWQAYRIKHSEGADGCIESAVRSFSIRSGGTSPPSPTPGPSPTPEEGGASLPRSLARLAGDFGVTTRLTSATGIANAKQGTADSGTWRFTPTCPKGACNARLRIEYGHLFTAEHVARITLKKAGAAYKGSTTVPLLECNFKDVAGTLTVTLTVTRGQWLEGRWRATRITGRQSFAAAATTSGIFKCPAARYTATVRGQLEK